VLEGACGAVGQVLRRWLIVTAAPVVVLRDSGTGLVSITGEDPGIGEGLVRYGVAGRLPVVSRDSVR
jgi:hypothetical protein